jgi:hypothetical protein
MKMKHRKTWHTVLGLNLARGLALLAHPNSYFGLAGAGVVCGARSPRPRPSQWHDRDGLTDGSRVMRSAWWAPPRGGLPTGEGHVDGGSPKRRADSEGAVAFWGDEEAPVADGGVGRHLQHQRGDGKVRWKAIWPEKAWRRCSPRMAVSGDVSCGAPTVP